MQGSLLLLSLSGKERKLCAHPRLEIYQQDQIYFMCPLARQGDFYVPEVKETERKGRGPAEASDAQTDGTGTGARERGGPAGSPHSARGLPVVSRGSWAEVEGDLPPWDPQAELAVPRHVGPCRCGLILVTPGNADTRFCLIPSGATGVPWVTRLTAAGSRGRGWGARERRHVGLLGKQGWSAEQVLSCPQDTAPPRASRLLPAEEQPESAQRGRGSVPGPSHQGQPSDPGPGHDLLGPRTVPKGEETCWEHPKCPRGLTLGPECGASCGSGGPAPVGVVQAGRRVAVPPHCLFGRLPLSVPSAAKVTWRGLCCRVGV